MGLGHRIRIDLACGGSSDVDFGGHYCCDSLARQSSPRAAARPAWSPARRQAPAPAPRRAVGLVLRSNFWLGHGLPLSLEELEREMPLQLGLNLMQHSYQEWFYLARFLAAAASAVALPSRANEHERVRR